MAQHEQVFVSTPFIYIRGVAAVCGMMLTLGCATPHKNSHEGSNVSKSETYAPAILDTASKQNLDIIAARVSEALNGRTVQLASTVLQETSRLIMDPKRFMGPDGTPVMGRDLSRPDIFTLLKSSQGCAIRHEETGEIYRLEDITCRYENNP